MRQILQDAVGCNAALQLLSKPGYPRMRWLWIRWTSIWPGNLDRHIQGTAGLHTRVFCTLTCLHLFRRLPSAVTAFITVPGAIMLHNSMFPSTAFWEASSKCAVSAVAAACCRGCILAKLRKAVDTGLSQHQRGPWLIIYLRMLTKQLCFALPQELRRAHD